MWLPCFSADGVRWHSYNRKKALRRAEREKAKMTGKAVVSASTSSSASASSSTTSDTKVIATSSDDESDSENNRHPVTDEHYRACHWGSGHGVPRNFVECNLAIQLYVLQKITQLHRQLHVTSTQRTEVLEWLRKKWLALMTQQGISTGFEREFDAKNPDAWPDGLKCTGDFLKNVQAKRQKTYDDAKQQVIAAQATVASSASASASAPLTLEQIDALQLTLSKQKKLLLLEKQTKEDLDEATRDLKDGLEREANLKSVFADLPAETAPTIQPTVKSKLKRKRASSSKDAKHSNSSTSVTSNGSEPNEEIIRRIHLLQRVMDEILVSRLVYRNKREEGCWFGRCNHESNPVPFVWNSKTNADHIVTLAAKEVPHLRGLAVTLGYCRAVVIHEDAVHELTRTMNFYRVQMTKTFDHWNLAHFYVFLNHASQNNLAIYTD